jgi:hypothetical protein
MFDCILLSRLFAGIDFLFDILRMSFFCGGHESEFVSHWQSFSIHAGERSTTKTPLAAMCFLPAGFAIIIDKEDIDIGHARTGEKYRGASHRPVPGDVPERIATRLSHTGNPMYQQIGHAACVHHGDADAGFSHGSGLIDVCHVFFLFPLKNFASVTQSGNAMLVFSDFSCRDIVCETKRL